MQQMTAMLQFARSRIKQNLDGVCRFLQFGDGCWFPRSRRPRRLFSSHETFKESGDGSWRGDFDSNDEFSNLFLVLVARVPQPRALFECQLDPFRELLEFRDFASASDAVDADKGE